MRLRTNSVQFSIRRLNFRFGYDPMQQTFHIEGMHCDACVNRVNKALASLAQHVQVTLDPPQARLQVAVALPLETVQSALQKAGDYRAAPVDA
jgi:copper chaperone CopZ